VWRKKNENKNKKREATQDVIYDASWNAFYYDVAVNKQAHKCLAELTELEREWKDACKKGDPGPKQAKRNDIVRWAMKYGIKLPPAGIDPRAIGDYLAERGAGRQGADEYDYYEWRKTVPAEVGVFKECSEDVVVAR
jgi:hypothetical protein